MEEGEKADGVGVASRWEEDVRRTEAATEEVRTRREKHKDDKRTYQLMLPFQRS